MCRSARGDIEIAGKFRHFPHEPDEAAVAAAGKARFALVLDRPAHLVAACQTVDLGAVLGQPCQKRRKIIELLGNDMDDAAFLLYTADHRDIARAQDHRTQTFEYFRPYDHIGDRGFVFDGHEHDPVGRARSLPASDQP